jgi:hypothetical protein
LYRSQEWTAYIDFDLSIISIPPVAVEVLLANGILNWKKVDKHASLKENDTAMRKKRLNLIGHFRVSILLWTPCA